MGDHREGNRFEGGHNNGRFEERREPWQQELEASREHGRTPYRQAPETPVNGSIEFGSCYPGQEQWGHRDGNFAHAWQQPGSGYEIYQTPVVEAPNYYQTGFQVGVATPDVYPAPVVPAPNYYENNSVSGGPYGFQANQQVETGTAPDSTMGTVNTVFNDVLAGFDAYAAYDVARRDAGAPRFVPTRWR